MPAFRKTKGRDLTVAMESAIKVVSFNLKRDSRFARSHRWEYRRELVTRLIEESGAAVVGVQEMLPSMKADIQRRLNAQDILSQ